MQIENVRRKHNYLPLIVEVLKVLAKRGELVQLCEQVYNQRQLIISTRVKAKHAHMAI